ncbi:DNA-3-methyladenine glycosylase I [Rhodohalobacter mucosus]|uniref:DNA-3-methyladenine glycosylase I n=1 Tax=Rhodohalobacter mucosus TaxID=2079485 RepID=A0A316TM47_9BACT|nr:DNA-3-methyladenine glycosylase I [Rhodohalobacter mucosus]PWN05657.1 DNA-3-methyladenine glycosylase I [Rhodohalobacter mucosus]
MSSDYLSRCKWAANTSDEYITYHDEEWGVPVHDDRTHFEFLILEGAQAGLSWSTILKKRSGYRKAFAGFDPAIVADYTESKIEELLQNPGIVRNRLKVKSAVRNAREFLKIQDGFGSFDAYIWQFVDNKPIINCWKSLSEVPAKTEVSDRISKDLRKRGFNFVGSTIIYAYMQACGLVNDHTVDCFRRRELL